jgi:Uma2 family endonuclease
MGATAKTLLTPEQFDNYPFEEDKRYELDEGELIEMTRPAYKHNRVLKKLLVELELYLRNHPVGEALISENLYALSPLTRRSPGVAVILGNRHEELKDAKVISIVPEIAAEVLSPSETPGMMQRKLEQYFRAGVNEAWILNLSTRNVEIWTGPAHSDHKLSGEGFLTSPLLPGFALPIEELFS